jgi:hypothetical protein
MKVRDCDGDIWESDEEGGWECTSDPGPHGYSYLPNRESLEIVWGPLTELED